MKRFLVIVTVALFGFAFGCGGAPVPEVEAPEAPEVEAPEVDAPEVDAPEVEPEVPATEATE